MKLEFSNDELKPLVQEIVAEVLAARTDDEARIGGKLAFTEAEAARLLSMQKHQLRDERLDGRIEASVGRGGRILYSRDDLLKYLHCRRWCRKK